MSSAQIAGDGDLKKIQEAAKTHQSELTAAGKVYKIFRFADGNNARYRIIYELPNGYSEVLGEIAKSTGTISLQSYQAYTASPAEKTVDIAQDPLGVDLYGSLFQNYPELQGKELLKSYASIDGGISNYRFLYLLADKGIVEIEILMAPRFSQSQIVFVELTQLTKSEYKDKLKYFSSKYTDVIKSDAVV